MADVLGCPKNTEDIAMTDYEKLSLALLAHIADGIGSCWRKEVRHHRQLT
jgi:hypothetical protein